MSDKLQDAVDAFKSLVLARNGFREAEAEAAHTMQEAQSADQKAIADLANAQAAVEEARKSVIDAVNES